MFKRVFLAAIAAAVFTLPGCSQPTGSTGIPSSSAGLAQKPPARPDAGPPIGNYIKHIVIIVQENRSFDNIFAGFPGADAPTFGYTHTGAEVPLRPIDFTAPATGGGDLGHNYANAIAECDPAYVSGVLTSCAMDAFDKEVYQNSTPAGNAAYAYLERSLVQPYWSMAHQYVLADRMFQTEWGGSFTSHLDLIAGTTALSNGVDEVDSPSVPWTCQASPGTVTFTINSPNYTIKQNGPFPCFNQFTTMAQTLDAAGVTWRYYAPTAQQDVGGQIWSTYAAIAQVACPQYPGTCTPAADWTNDVISPQTAVLTDITFHNLKSVSWVVPDFLDSDHPGSNSNTGPSWVGSIVNAIGRSSYWNSTAIVVLWDDWGGWYDDAAPPQLDLAGLGDRVPCLIISPYAKAHYVDHTQYEFGSVLKFVEQTFNVASLGATDARANSISDAFNFYQTPRPFTSIATPYAQRFFLKRPPSHRPPDNE